MQHIDHQRRIACVCICTCQWLKKPTHPLLPFFSFDNWCFRTQSLFPRIYSTSFLKVCFLHKYEATNWRNSNKTSGTVTPVMNNAATIRRATCGLQCTAQMNVSFKTLYPVVLWRDTDHVCLSCLLAMFVYCWFIILLNSHLIKEAYWHESLNYCYISYAIICVAISVLLSLLVWQFHFLRACFTSNENLNSSIN